jgi:hypothetical protein
MKNLLIFVIGFFIAISSCLSAQMVLLPDQPFPNAQKAFVEIDSVKANNGTITYEIWEASYEPFKRVDQGSYMAIGYFWRNWVNCKTLQFQYKRMGYLKKEGGSVVVIEDRDFFPYLNLLMPAPPAGSSKYSEISYICQKFSR